MNRKTIFKIIALYGAIIKSTDSSALMTGNMFLNCEFSGTTNKTIVTSGDMYSLVLVINRSDQTNNSFKAKISYFVNFNNSWNR